MCAGQAGEVFMANVFKTQEITHYTPKTLPNSTTPKKPCSLPIKPSTVMYMTSASHTQNNTAPNMVTPREHWNFQEQLEEQIEEHLHFPLPQVPV